MVELARKDSNLVAIDNEGPIVRTTDHQPNRLPVKASFAIAEKLTALLGSRSTLLIDADGPDYPIGVPGTTIRVQWQNWQCALPVDMRCADYQLAPAGQGTKDHYDLVVCVDHDLLWDDSVAESLRDWMTKVTDDIAVISLARARGTENSLLAQPRWAEPFARRGFFRLFDNDFAMVSQSVAHYRSTGASLPEVVGQYEAALAVVSAYSHEALLAESRLVGGGAQQQRQAIAARHDALHDRDRAFGMMARLLSLQYEVDYWQTQVSLQEMAQGNLKRKLYGILSRYRIGSFVLIPFRALRKLVRSIKHR